MSPETHAPRPLWTPALPRSVLLPLTPIPPQLSARWLVSGACRYMSHAPAALKQSTHLQGTWLRGAAQEMGR